MNKFQSLVDTEMKRLNDEGPDAKDPDITPFYEALLANEKFCNGLCNAMEKAATNFAATIMSKPSSPEDMRQVLTTKPMARPLLGLTYMGFLMGKSAAQTESLEKMFATESEAK